MFRNVLHRSLSVSVSTKFYSAFFSLSFFYSLSRVEQAMDFKIQVLIIWQVSTFYFVGKIRSLANETTLIRKFESKNSQEFKFTRKMRKYFSVINLCFIENCSYVRRINESFQREKFCFWKSAQISPDFTFSGIYIWWNVLYQRNVTLMINGFL